MNKKDIGRFIATCRKDKGMTQEQLSEILGVSSKSISRWENGKTMPDITLYEPLCNALGIQISELLNGKRLDDSEKISCGEKLAFNVLATKSQLETLAIFTEVLILIGIIISITFTRFIATTTAHKIITLIAGWFVWGFGLVLRVKIRRAIMKLENNFDDNTNLR